MNSKSLLRFSVIALLCVSSNLWANTFAETSQRLMQMLDYVGVDYPPTIHQGEMIDAVEYEEMQEFSGEILNLIRLLPEKSTKASLLVSGQQIKNLIESRADGEAVTRLTQSVKASLIDVYDLNVAPKKIPSTENIQAIYDSNCTSCHGTMGYGDGPLSIGMEPAPGNFHDDVRQRNRSVYDLYNTISLGVKGTPMPSFNNLTEEQRWALAFRIGSYSSSAVQRENGKNLWQQGVMQERFKTLGDLTSASFAHAAEFADHSGNAAQDGIDVLAFLRSQPEELNITDNFAIDNSIEKLSLSVELLAAGERKAAHKEALSAYLDGFELAEGSLGIVNRILKSRIEKEMILFRQLVKTADLDEVEQQRDVIVDLLVQAKNEISESSMSPAAAFAGSFIILLREGVEAILVLAAIMAALIKTGRREAMKYIHFGWSGAVVLGLITWWLADNLITISGASREITEGVAALLAAIILIYVGFWLHNASHSKRWKQFVEHKIDNAMEGSTLWALAIISFLAVYREMFETVLFYQAMWVQLETSSHQGFLTGIFAAVALLFVLAILIFRVGTKLPIKLFFQVNAVLLFLLAVVFSGQGIAALQEAGLVDILTIDFPTISFLGMHPTVQGLSLQLFVLVLGSGLLIYQKKSQ